MPHESTIEDKPSLRPDVEAHVPGGLAPRTVHFAGHGVSFIRELEGEEERIVASRAVEVESADGHGASRCGRAP